MTHSIELHMFTNSTVNAPSVWHITTTLDSFRSTFQQYSIVPTIWCDPNPNIQNSHQYITNLRNTFDHVNITTSLSHGYIQAVNSSTSDFLFMLEHDWRFTIPEINLSKIIDEMIKYDLCHLRFNKRANIQTQGDTSLTDVDGKLCLTNFVSNNPHIINRELYIKVALPYITVKSGSRGIEEQLRNKNIRAALYGPLKFPCTIAHLDGRLQREIHNA